MKYLVDTCVISEFTKKNPDIYLNASKRSINNRIDIACNLFDTDELIEISV